MGAVEAGVKARDFVREVLAERRREPQDDLMTILAQSEYQDIDGQTKHLTDAEVVGFITLLGQAGAETTAKLIGNALVYLFRDPSLRQRIWDEPHLIPQAIEELMQKTPSDLVRRG